MGDWLRGLLRTVQHGPADDTAAETSPLAENEIGFDNDAPIDRPERDVFGFEDIAERLSVSVLSMTQREGLVIGIEGPWGSGKSSLTNLLTAKIYRTEGATVVPFAPWIVGSRDELISSLMGAIAAELDRLEQQKDPEGKSRNVSSLSRKLRTYGIRAGKGLGPIAHLASVAIPGASAAGLIVDQGTKFLESLEGGTTPLITLKAEIAMKLRGLTRRFVVVIDDLDRLEPREVVEVLRLVRAVGDFPNVVYVLCYDKKILSESINSALRIADGDRYLQKIVQASFSVPLPEDTELRHWLYNQSAELYHATTGRPLNTELDKNVSEAVMEAGEILKTPRDVVQVVNALRLFFPPIALDVHYGDLVWLQILKVARRDLYDWIEGYLTEYSTVAHGDGKVEPTNGKRLSRELHALLPEDGHGNDSVWSVWGRLPGITAGFEKPDEVKVFDHVSYDEMQGHQAGKRLASPVHYRYYFSFTAARNAFSDARLIEILRIAAEEPDRLVSTFRGLLTEERRYGSTWFEHFLRRLLYRGFDGLTDNQVEDLVWASTSLADEALRAADDEGASGYDPIWSLCSDLVRLGLRHFANDRRSQLLTRVVRSSPSLGWIIGGLIGPELYRHNRIESTRSYSEAEIVFTEGELDHAISIARQRLGDQNDLKRLRDTPRFLSVIYRWEAIAGSLDPVQQWLRQFEESENFYLDLLFKLRGWAMSDRVYRPLHRRDLDHFLNYDEVVSRLQGIAERGGDNASRAVELIKATELSRGFE